MSRIIEFMGLPGSGKSTLARALLEDLRAHGPALLGNEEAVARCLRRRDDGILGNLLKRLPAAVWEPLAGSRRSLAELHLSASAHTELFALLFEVLSRRPVPRAWRECILYAFFKRCAERQLFDAHLAPGEGVVLEEGFAMGVVNVCSLPPESRREQDVPRYVRGMPRGFAAFWVDAEPAECAARLRRRPEVPVVWAECSDAELLERLEHGRRCYRQAVAELESQGVPVCTVPNAAGGVESAASRVRSQGRQWARTMLA